MDTNLKARERLPDTGAPMSGIDWPVPLEGEATLQFPCAPEQLRLWRLHQIDARHPALNVAARWRLEGKISSSALEKAFALMIARHAALRTCIVDAGGEPTQIVEPRVMFRISVIDLTSLPEADAHIEAERAARLEANTPFELAMPPLIRVTLLRMSSNISILLVTLHHIIGDARSSNILALETSEICRAFHASRLPQLPILPISYGDFSIAQAARHASAQKADVEFWTHTLHGVRHFELQPDHRRPLVLTTNRNLLSLQLDRQLTVRLAKLADDQCGTLFNVGLAALITLLYRYTGETDIALGSEFSGRDAPELDNLVGLFSRTLLLRNDVSDDPSFVELIARVRATVANSLAHNSVALEQLVEIVNPKLDLSRNPLFSVAFSSAQSIKLVDPRAGFTVVDLPSRSSNALCELSFVLVERLEGWQISCEFNVDLYDGQTIIRLLNHFQTLLRAAVVNPKCKISSLPILDDAERRMLVVDNNQTSAFYPKHLTFPQLFQAQAARTPDALALVCGEQVLTYRELDIASNRLAHELRSSGIGPGSRVAVFLDRSAELIVALVAVLKSGNAYIPLDPAYPEERLRHVFENSQPAAVITRTPLRKRLVENATPAILLDAEATQIAEQSAEPLAPSALPQDPAYIIYTSGSTGRPKGVVIPHRALVNLLSAMRVQPSLTPDDAVVCITTISFDIAVMDVFLPLVVGAKLVFAKEHEMLDGVALLALLRRHSATFMQATPVTWQLLLEAGWQGQPALKMLCGGEALPRKLAQQLLQCGGELWNMYGPTETTVWSSALRIQSGEGSVPMGPPIANTQFYILDNSQEVVPHGVPGELYIGGDGVGLGYYNLPVVTAEKFVADKFNSRAGAMMYRTGDRVRMKQHGCMEYLGRTDHQIKLRGFRIELGEIEAVLLQYPGITDAVAVLGQDAAGEGALWAYAVAPGAQTDAPEVLVGALRAQLLQSLPAYMCPSAIVLLDALPRTPNGKIDRRALPEPAPVLRQGKEPVQPLNEVERRLAAIWSSVLGLETIDKTAEFFGLGGHSLLAARLLARIEAEFGQRLSLLALFNAPTIEAQAKLLMDSKQREYDFRQVVRLQSTGTQSPLIAIHNTGVYYYNLSKLLGVDQPLTALQLFDPSIKRESFPQTTEEIAAEYVQLIQTFQPNGPYKLIGWCAGGVLAFEVARQLVAAGQKVALLAMIDAWAPGHNRRLSRWHAALADYSYRWQLIAADWRRVMTREQSLASFFAQRTLVKKIVGVLQPKPVAVPTPTPFEARELSAENYDQWLLGYLEETERHYEPKIYLGKITLLCSAQEPHGWFLDPQMGWGNFAAEGVDVAVIDGDHFTMFKGQGLEQMATYISKVLGRSITGVQSA